MIKKSIILLSLLIIGLLAISSIGACEIADETDRLSISENDNLVIDEDDNIDNTYNSNELGDTYDEYDNEPAGYKVAFFNDTSVVNLNSDKIKWDVKNLTESIYYPEYNETIVYNVSLSTFRLNNTEYTVEHYLPTTGQYGDYVYVKFNPDEYNCHDGILYKTVGNNIVEVIAPLEYHIFDGEYYKIVGILSETYELDNYIDCSIINNKCYKFVGSISPYVADFFYNATEGKDYDIINGEYYTLDGDALETFAKKYFDEDEGNDTVINGVYLTSFDGVYYYHHATRYSIAPYDYIRINDTFYKLLLGEGKYNTTEEYGGVAYNVTKNNEYTILNKQLYNITNGAIDSIVNLTDDGNDNIVIKAQDVTKYYGGDEKFTATILKNGKPVTEGYAYITINNMEYKRTIKETGQISLNLNLNSGQYNVTTKYKNVTEISLVTIKETIASQNITKYFKNDTQYYATFYDSEGKLLKNRSVKFNVNGVYYTRQTNDKGVARMNINLIPSEYIITATNPSTKEEYSSIITVLSTISENSDLTKYYKNDSQYRVRLLNHEGKHVDKGVKVKFNINGIFYTRSSDADGYAKLNINLVPGDYVITADYEGLMVSNNIKVLPVLSAENLNMNYHDGSKFAVTLLDGKGNQYENQNVTFNINGVFYTRITDVNGQAKLKINLPQGNYTITSSYDGSNIANKIVIGPEKAQPDNKNPLATGVTVEIDEYDKKIDQTNGTYVTEAFVCKNSTTVCEIQLNNTKTYPDDLGALGQVKKSYYETRIYSNMTGIWGWSDWDDGYNSSGFDIHRYEYPATDFEITKIAVRTIDGLSDDGYSFYADCEIAPEHDSMGITKKYAIENGMHYLPEQAMGEYTGRYLMYDSQRGIIYD